MRLQKDKDTLDLFAAPGAVAEPAKPIQLSKSRFVAGHQCHKLLWWKVHEPLAKELQPDKVLQDRFDQGALVGAMARELFPDGVSITGSHHDVAAKVDATRRAMESGATAIFEATFVADSCVVSVDVLLRDGDGWRLIEVKMTTSQKEEHLIDCAVQLHVLLANGLKITAVEVMHLDKECRFPDLSNLLTRTDVTADAVLLLPGIPTELAAQLAMLAGAIPDADIGLRCSKPHDCAFQERCWPADADHITNLYWVGRGKRGEEWMKKGIKQISAIPPKQKLNVTQKRQIRAMQENRMIVEPELRSALEPFDCRLGFLDFETIVRAVPVWPGMHPWQQEPAQFSYHEANEKGSYSHSAFLAEGPDDCRPTLVERMLQATAGADRVVMYSSFEKTRIQALQEAVPQFATELKALEGKLIDLLPVMREHVYHPAFNGSFSIKHVLTPMVPELTYQDLIIIDGLTASVEIARLLFVSGRIPLEEQARVREELLRYCERDTWAMVKLLERIRQLAA